MNLPKNQNSVFIKLENVIKNFFFFKMKNYIGDVNDEIYSKYISSMTFISTSKQKQTSQLIKEFMNTDLYSQRSTIIQLLFKSHEHDLRYLSYLLYDMLYLKLLKFKLI